MQHSVDSRKVCSQCDFERYTTKLRAIGCELHAEEKNGRGQFLAHPAYAGTLCH